VLLHSLLPSPVLLLHFLALFGDIRQMGIFLTAARSRTGCTTQEPAWRPLHKPAS